MTKQRREWSVYIADEEISLDRYHGCDDELIKVTELFPGDRVISRAELRAAMERAHDPIRGLFISFKEMDAIERELFGKAET